MKKHKLNKYFKATGMYTVGSVFNKAISLLLLPIFTRLLSTSSYGIVSTYTSWVNVVTIIVGAQLNLTIRPAMTDYKKDINKYIFSINLLSFFIFIFLLIVLSIITKIFFSDIILILTIFGLIQSFFTSIINVELQKQMMQLEYMKRTLLLALPNLIAALLGIIYIVLIPSIDYMGRIITMVAVYIIIGGYYFVKYFKIGKIKKISSYWKYAIAFSGPLIFHGIASVLLNNIDRTMITMFNNTSETGLYSVAYTMGMALIAVTSAMESVWIPWFTKKIESNQIKKINDVGKIYVIIGSLVCIILMLLMPEVLKIFADKEYWDAIYILPPIMLSSYMVFLFTISANIEYYYKSTKFVALNTIIATIINIILNVFFIPKFGALAAAYTTLISYLISFVLHFKYANNLNKSMLPFKTYIKPITAVSISTIFTYLFINNIILRWGISIVIIIILLVVLKMRKDFFVNILKEE